MGRVKNAKDRAVRASSFGMDDIDNVDATDKEAVSAAKKKINRVMIGSGFALLVTTGIAAASWGDKTSISDVTNAASGVTDSKYSSVPIPSWSDAPVPSSSVNVSIPSSKLYYSLSDGSTFNGAYSPDLYSRSLTYSTLLSKKYHRDFEFFGIVGTKGDLDVVTSDGKTAYLVKEDGTGVSDNLYTKYVSRSDNQIWVDTVLYGTGISARSVLADTGLSVIPGNIDVDDAVSIQKHVCSPLAITVVDETKDYSKSVSDFAKKFSTYNEDPVQCTFQLSVVVVKDDEEGNKKLSNPLLNFKNYGKVLPGSIIRTETYKLSTSGSVEKVS